MQAQAKYLPEHGLVRILPTDYKNVTFKEGFKRRVHLFLNGVPREIYLVHASKALDRAEVPFQTSEPMRVGDSLAQLFAARVEFASQVASYIKRDLPASKGVLSFPAAYEVLQVKPCPKREEGEEPDTVSEFAWLFFDQLFELRKDVKAHMEVRSAGSDAFLARSDSFIRHVDEMEKRAAQALQHQLLVQTAYNIRVSGSGSLMGEARFKETCLSLAAARLKTLLSSNKSASSEFDALSSSGLLSMLNSLILAAIEVGSSVDLKSSSPFFRALFAFGIQMHPSYSTTNIERRERVDEALINPIDQGETLKVLDERTLARGICHSVRGFSSKWLSSSEVIALLQELAKRLPAHPQDPVPGIVLSRKDGS